MSESLRAMGQVLMPLRTAAFVGLTFGMYGLLEVDTFTHEAAQRELILHKWIERYGRSLLSLYGVEVVTQGIPEGRQLPGADGRGKGRVFVMNHRSGLDVPLSLSHAEATIVSRADLARWPVIGVAARRVGTLFVDRSNKQSGAAVVQAMCGALERGRGVMVYPEGTTYSGDDVRPFRAGAFLAAANTGAEIVPLGVAYDGAGTEYGDESFLDHMKRVSATPRTRVALLAGEPIQAEGTAKDLERRAHTAVQSLVHEARALLQKKTASRPSATAP
jgi:1-acyl-sn-glycerol-3-phosphate acyltransferase